MTKIRPVMHARLAISRRERKKERKKERKREMTLTAARWKAAFLPLAHGGCLHARHLLSAAMSDLSSPQLLLDRDDAGRYVRLISATNNVESASTCLSFSLDVTAAAELVALRGCGRSEERRVGKECLL